MTNTNSAPATAKPAAPMQHHEPLVPVMPLEPFCGSYACPINEADTIATVFHEDAITGEISKRRQGRKHFSGKVDEEVSLSPDIYKSLKEGGFLTENGKALHPDADLDAVAALMPKRQGMTVSGVSLAEMKVFYSVSDRTVMVPRDMADNLVKRGLAERVSAKAAKAS